MKKTLKPSHHHPFWTYMSNTTVTIDQVETLESEAWRAGDTKTVSDCRDTVGWLEDSENEGCDEPPCMLRVIQVLEDGAMSQLEDDMHFTFENTEGRSARELVKLNEIWDADFDSRFDDCRTDEEVAFLERRFEAECFKRIDEESA